jgi:hypothetical protein
MNYFQPINPFHALPNTPHPKNHKTTSNHKRRRSGNFGDAGRGGEVKLNN